MTDIGPGFLRRRHPGQNGAMTYRTRRRMYTTLLIGSVLTLTVIGIDAAGNASAAAQAPGRTVWDTVYSKAQASRGAQSYKTSCGYCHKDDLSGGFLDDGAGRAPALAGPLAFGSSLVNRWKDQTLGDLVYAIASSMPKEAPTSLALETYIDITAYLLESNGAPAGESELPADVVALRQIIISSGPR